MILLWLLTWLSIFGFILGQDRIPGNDIPGYFWKDYNGDLPLDALPGGIDKFNNKIYIGQTMHPKPRMTVPGRLNPETKSMTYQYFAEEYTVDASWCNCVKVLCTQNPHNFRWITAEDKQPVDSIVMGNMRTVHAGIDNGDEVIVGRRITGDDIGKILIKQRTFLGLWVPSNGNGNAKREEEFQVLIYNPNGGGGGEVGGGGSSIIINIIINIFNSFFPWCKNFFSFIFKNLGSFGFVLSIGFTLFMNFVQFVVQICFNSRPPY